ncbi:phosphoribosylanthranilate isomerase [Erythrobacter insulae]|uniref:N-(5'-phosphoribosyl)anthranilate isomerase n=1 Tax=Erythrobacter insulae TaxID=2584124 RepID=A0A547PE42_9SPHN|nr:phosphoribosylanthranilate isomerase [Erythrobacter insulae]TRD12397.1 phosphoribosylanthranilate isomerase [Erythrobacter insulae]
MSQSTQIKICGLSTPETLSAAIGAGATHVGLVHFEPSPRHLSLEDAARLRAMVPGGVKVVLLTVNADVATTGKAIELVKPDVIQFHGNETPEWIKVVREKTKVEAWKALGVKDAQTLANSARFEGAVDRLLFDAPAKGLPGGNGETFRWDVLKGFDHRIPWGLAGGLTPDNVADAIRETGTDMVDASSGLESAPGVKDVDKIAAFCKAAFEA